MKKVAVFAGSFDPITVGHLDIIARASKLFDELWVLVAINASKKYMLQESVRKSFIEKAVAGLSDFSLNNVKVASFEGLTVDFMKMVGACYLVRGLRGSRDVEFEQSVAWNNQVLYPECETFFMTSRPEHLAVSSTVVRELLKCGIADDPEGLKKLEHFVPATIVEDLIRNHKIL